MLAVILTIVTFSNLWPTRGTKIESPRIMLVFCS